jgi:hypothetical protein
MNSNRTEVLRLNPYEKAVGELKGFKEAAGTIFAVVGNIVLALPLELKEALSPLVGRRIGILRTDIPNKLYLVREIPDSKRPLGLNTLELVGGDAI